MRIKAKFNFAYYSIDKISNQRLKPLIADENIYNTVLGHETTHQRMNSKICCLHSIIE